MRPKGDQKKKKRKKKKKICRLSGWSMAKDATLGGRGN
jgi:hypothetical protein